MYLQTYYTIQKSKEVIEQKNECNQILIFKFNHLNKFENSFQLCLDVRYNLYFVCWMLYNSVQSTFVTRCLKHGTDLRDLFYFNPMILHKDHPIYYITLYHTY